MSPASFAINAPVKVTMIFLGVLLLGWISLGRLPTNLFPDIRAPRITVTVDTNGLSPAEVERRICEVIERSLYSIRGVTGVRSISRADSAVIVVNFSWETRLEYAFLEVKKAASDLQRDRSNEIESVTVLRYDPNATPVITAALVAPSDVDLESVFRAAEQTLKPRFERLEGVANVVLTGGLQREIQVNLDESLLLSYNLNVSDVVTALQADNVDATGGWVEEGARRYLLKAIGQFQNIGEVERVVVTRRGDAPILVSDVAQVVNAPRESKSIVYQDGKPGVGMAFYREAESNTVAVAKGIRDEIEASARVLPGDWKLTVANDQSIFIKSAIDEVKNNALLGGLLSIVVLMLFLRDFRTTMIISIAIPISVIATFNLIYFQGLSLNLMSLGGLALGCGMLVDNAIVVLENVFRLRGEGVAPMEAARRGASEVGGALIASTATTIAVFLPIVYVKGVAGLLFKEQAMTVAYSLLASLVVALLLIPMLCAYFLGEVKRTGKREDENFDVPCTPYARLLALALRARFLVLIAAGVVMALTIWMFRSIPQEFLPPTQSRQVAMRLTLPNGTPIEATDRVAMGIIGQLERFEPAIEKSFARVGEPEGVVNPNTENPDGPNTADIYVTLRDADNPTTAMIEADLANFTSSRFVETMKPFTEAIPDAKVEFRTGEGSIFELLGTSSAPLLIEISGPELDRLSSLAQEISGRLLSAPSLLNVRTNILDGAPEVRLKLDKTQLARYGLQVNGVATILKQRIDGSVATQVRRESGDVDLRVQVDYGEENLETLRNITFKSSGGALVRLEAIAELEIVRAPREIVRQKQERVAYVMADLADGAKLSSGIADARAALDGMNVPPRYALRYTGEEEERAKAFGDLAFALILSIALVYMVMASVFESFLQPFLIMFSIPLAGIGVVAGLSATGQSLNVMSIIGVVMLGGIVVNNAIVLLDCVNQVRARARESGLALDASDALVIGCGRRLRPVLMTTATTLLGLLPMAVGWGEGAELRQAMAITVLGGLASSTILTLFVIPVGQSYLDSLIALARRIMGGKKG